MKTTFAILLCWATSAVAAPATPVPADFVGGWTVTWQGEKRVFQAKLNITESGGGSWKTSATSKSDACVGQEVPIEFEKLVSEEAHFRLKFSEALHGCQDAKIKLKKLSEQELTGSRGKLELKLVKD